MSFVFNGIRKGYLTATRGTQRPTWAPIKRNIITIKGREGGYLESTDTEVRPIPVNIRIKNNEFPSLQKLKEDLAKWLITENPAELIFDDETDRVYYAAVDGSLDLDEIVNLGKGTITFICPDPYKYSEEESLDFIDTTVVNVNGSVDTYPVITCTFNQDSTFVAVKNGTELVNMIGKPSSVEDTPYVREEIALSNTGNNMIGWNVSGVVETGIIAGTIDTNGYDFIATDYGTGADWHGPAIKTSIPSGPLTDFIIELNLYAYNDDPNQIGRLEAYMLDVNNEVIGKFSFHDVAYGYTRKIAEIGIGDLPNRHYLLQDDAGDWWSAYNHFDGIMRLSKSGTTWEAYVAQIDQTTGEHYSVRVATFEDTENKFNAPLAQLELHIGQYGTDLVSYQGFRDVKIYKINQYSNGIPFIVTPGDVVEFDHVNSIIRRNGVDITKDKAFIGEYFPLKIGSNTITVQPSTALQSCQIRWRDRWR